MAKAKDPGADDSVEKKSVPEKASNESTSAEVTPLVGPAAKPEATTVASEAVATNADKTKDTKPKEDGPNETPTNRPVIVKSDAGPASIRPDAKSETTAKAAIKDTVVIKDNVVSSFDKPGAKVDRPDQKPEQKADAQPPKPKPAGPKNAGTPTGPANPARGGSTFWPLVVGGVIAAVLGFLASEINVFGNRSENADLRVSLTRQQAQIAELEQATDAPATPAVGIAELDTLKTQVSGLSGTLADLEARLAEVEQRPLTQGSATPDATADLSGYERELTELRASMAQQQEEIEGLLANARSVEEATAEAARAAALQSALTRVTAAINNGKPFAASLDDLGANGVADIPVALTDISQTGPVTLINLQTRFPESARAALAQSRTESAGDGQTGVTGFLRRQLGARSVTPREGTDPDAILSRAEAAVRDGRLTDALAELDTLPDAAKTAMADWIADARSRQAAEAATEDLSQRLTAN